MATYVLRDGVLVDRRMAATLDEEDRARRRADFPTPRLSRIEPYASPIDGKEITSWAQRDKDLADSNSYDPRDYRETPYAEPRRPTQLDLFAPRDDA